MNVYISRRFIRFIIVGIINTLFGAGIYSLLLYWGVSYSWAILIGTILGVLFNFKTTGIYVFNSHDNRLIFKFFIVYFVVYVVNVLIVRIFVKCFDVNAYIAGYIAIPIAALISYVLQKKIVFRKK